MAGGVSQGPPPAGTPTHAVYEVNIQTHSEVNEEEVKTKFAEVLTTLFKDEEHKITLFEVRRNEKSRQARVHAVVEGALVGADPAVMEYALREAGFGGEYTLTFTEELDVRVTPYHPSQRG